jgi:hypothetical protein
MAMKRPCDDLSHRSCRDASNQRTPAMKTLNFRPLVATALLAASLGTIPVHAQDLQVDATTDESVPLERIAARHVVLDLAGADVAANVPMYELGPQYLLNQKVALGGEWQPLQPAFVRGRPSLDRYTFGGRVSF